MKSESKERWTVSCRETTVQNKRVSVTSSLREEKRYEWRLVYEGHVCHVLSGIQAEDSLRSIAKQWNESDYQPKFVKGKIYMDLGHAERLKLAILSSPPLPFTEEGAS
jgi:hypothetical protein